MVRGSLLLRTLSRSTTIHAGRFCSAATPARRASAPLCEGRASTLQRNNYPGPLLSATRYAAAHPPALVTARHASQKALGGTVVLSNGPGDSTQKGENKSKDDNKSKDGENESSNKSSNILLDYLGTVFLTGLGMIVLALVRSYKGGNNRNRTREAIEQASALDPLEIDDLRLANAGLTLEAFRRIRSELAAAHDASLPTEEGGGGGDGEPKLLYSEFVRRVRIALRSLRGGDDSFTVELGHYLDRVVLEALGRRGEVTTQDPQPVAFWLTVLSLALNAPVPERILALYEVASGQQQPRPLHVAAEDHDGGGGNGRDVDQRVTVRDTRKLVGYLQDTCQLTPDTQVVEDPDRKYPIQQYVRGEVGRLFEWDGPDGDELDIDAFSSILRSRAVCVWGECYHRRKMV